MNYYITLNKQTKKLCWLIYFVSKLQRQIKEQIDKTDNIKIRIYMTKSTMRKKETTKDKMGGLLYPSGSINLGLVKKVCYNTLITSRESLRRYHPERAPSRLITSREREWTRGIHSQSKVDANDP